MLIPVAFLGDKSPTLFKSPRTRLGFCYSGDLENLRLVSEEKNWVGVTGIYLAHCGDGWPDGPHKEGPQAPHITCNPTICLGNGHRVQALSLHDAVAEAALANCDSA